MLDLQKFLGKPQIEVNEGDGVTTFRYGPLPAGLGNSLGNMIRRTVLAYNPAIAVTGLKIDGVSHEYTTISGVKESVLQILLNFKELRFIGELPENPYWVHQSFKGVGKYTVENLQLPEGVEIVTENSYLFEITDPNIELNISFRLEKGYRYLSLAELKKREDKKESSEVGLMLIDNDFKVVRRVSYTVDEVLSDFNSAPSDYVSIRVETISPKISSKELITFAAEVILSYLKMFVFDDSYVDRSLLVDVDELVVEGGSEEIVMEEVKKTPIDALVGLSERTRNALIKNGIEYVEELEKVTKSELLSMKGVGRKAIDEIEVALEREGKKLGSR